MGSSFVILQADEKHPSAALSGRLTVSAAWQKVAPYPLRRHPSSFVGGAYPSRERFETVPYIGFRAPPVNGISQSSTCICLPAEASAQAGAFLISLRKYKFHKNCSAELEKP